MKAMIPVEKFKTHEAQTPIPAVAVATEEATRAVAIQAVGGTPEEEATRGVVTLGAAVTDLSGKTATAVGTRRLTKGWRA